MDEDGGYGNSYSLRPNLAGCSYKTEKVNDDESEEEEPISIDEIVSAIQEYNNVAGSKKKIYISRAVVAEVSPHSTKELESYFSEHKAEIDAHIEKHGLKRNTNSGRSQVQSGEKSS